jgi:diguanylate cyclase (GGDEF)-like protein
VLAVLISSGILAVFFALIRRETAAYEGLREYLNSSLQRVSAVYDLAHAANAGVSLNSLASMLLDQTMRATGTDAGAVALVADNGQLELASSAGIEDQDKQRFAAAIASSALRAMGERKPILEDAPDGVCGLHRLLTAPLIGPGGPVGALTITSHIARRPRGGHTEFVQVLCSEAAMAIENVQLHAQLNRLASTDHLTGLANRREMERVLDAEAERARRYQRPLVVLAIDVDNLKAVNDCYGHEVGDRVLCALGRVLKRNLRNSDVAGRMGGDEFLVVLPETDRHGGEVLAARLQEGFVAEVEAMQSWKQMTAALGVSIGIAAAEGDLVHAGQLLTAADEILYGAKRGRRDRASLAATGDRGF